MKKNFFSPASVLSNALERVDVGVVMVVVESFITVEVRERETGGN